MILTMKYNKLFPFISNINFILLKNSLLMIQNVQNMIFLSHFFIMRIFSFFGLNAIPYQEVANEQKKFFFEFQTKNGFLHVSNTFR